MPIRFLTAGESHGPMLTTILEGVPAGIPLDVDAINYEMARRQVGYGSGGRMSIEKDAVQITSGFMAGFTTGAPIAMILPNRDFKNWKEKDIDPITAPRPGHADLTGAIKYGYKELRLSLERASARETAMRVAVGAICKQLLAQFEIEIVGYVTQIGQVKADISEGSDYKDIFAIAESNDVRSPDEQAAEAMHAAIRQAKIDKDTLGGIFEVVALNVPVGLGTHVHYDRRLDAALVSAMVSIQAMKGAEIGQGFKNATLRGSQVHDEIELDGDHLKRRTNRAGGIEGGISTGDPIVVRVAMKPISTMLRGADTVDLATGEESRTVYERSDFCATPRAVPVGEAMMAIVLVNALLEKLGGDSLEEMQPRFEQLRQNRLSDVPMDNVQWRFGYA